MINIKKNGPAAECGRVGVSICTPLRDIVWCHICRIVFFKKIKMIQDIQLGIVNELEPTLPACPNKGFLWHFTKTLMT